MTRRMSWTTCLRRKKQSETTRASGKPAHRSWFLRPEALRLENRDCPALVTVPLDFETPATGSVPQVTTSFGSVELVGFYESSIIDSDLRAAGHGGTVFMSSPQSNQFGTGRYFAGSAIDRPVLDGAAAVPGVTGPGSRPGFGIRNRADGRFQRRPGHL